MRHLRERFTNIENYIRQLFDEWLIRAAGIIFVLIIALVVFNILSDLPEEHPLFGVFNFAMVPVLFIAGGIVFVLAILKLRKKALDKQNAYLGKLIFLMSGGAIGIVLLVVGGFQLLEFTDSTAFCGELCHDVMEPEFTAHQASPHSRVKCSECHVGSGASYLVQSKVTGIPLIFSTLTNSYDHPVEAPVKNLRPARDTCEQCHRPEHFAGDIIRIHTTYADDEANTQSVNAMVLRVGGGEDVVARDIHWHIAAEVWYLPLDEKRQEIGWVRVEGLNGEFREYIDSKRATEITGDLIEEEKRLMDCIDCHNRATHIFQSPDELIDLALAQGKIDNSLPFIKREGLQALAPVNASLDEAIEKLEMIRNFYETNYPNIYEQKAEEIDAAIAELTEIARLTTFPHMKVTWDTYADNSGHQQWPGCNRCHGTLVETAGDRAGKVIDARCTQCHYTLDS